MLFIAQMPFVIFQDGIVLHIAPKMWLNIKSTGNKSVEGFSGITQGLLLPKLCSIEREWSVVDVEGSLQTIAPAFHPLWNWGWKQKSGDPNPRVLEMELMTGMVTTSWDLGLCDLACLVNFRHLHHYDMLVLMRPLWCSLMGLKVLRVMREKDRMWEKMD